MGQPAEASNIVFLGTKDPEPYASWEGTELYKHTGQDGEHTVETVVGSGLDRDQQPQTVVLINCPDVGDTVITSARVMVNAEGATCGLLLVFSGSPTSLAEALEFAAATIRRGR